jgi:hypothetical protein
MPRPGVSSRGLIADGRTLGRRTSGAIRNDLIAFKTEDATVCQIPLENDAAPAPALDQ